MKKFALLLLLVLPFISLQAQCYDDCRKESLLSCTDWRMDLRLAYYHPLSKEVREIFSGSWLDYEFEISKKLRNDNLELWMGVDWAHKKGHLPKKPRGYHNATKASIFPITLGLKRFFRVNRCIESYIGAGFCYSFFHFKNHSDFYAAELGSGPYDKQVYKNSLGGLIKVGFRYSLGKSTFFDLFADYYVTKRFKFSSDQFPERHLNFSGFKTGLGLGVFF